MGRKVIPTALRTAGYTVQLHDDHFPQETPDAVWCRGVGEKGWIILTKDKQIRCNRIELEALLSANVPCFCLDAANMTGPEMATAILAALPSALRMAEKYQPPFVAAISRSGEVSLLYSHDGILRQIGETLDAQAHRARIQLWPK